MTQRERIDETRDATVYDTPTTYQTNQFATTPASPQYDTDLATAVQPQYDADLATEKDRVRWGPIIAGLFTALSTLALLGVLGLAIGASSFDAGDQGRNFGIGAGVWGALSALLAFGLGGWTAARTAAVRGERNGLLNGTMVWVVAIPLLLYLLSSGIGSLLNTAGQVANTAATVAAPVAGQAANDPAAQAGVQNGAAVAQANAQALQAQAADPANQEAAADAIRRGAWGTLASLLFGLGAASLGGYLGARRTHTTTRRSFLG